MTREEAERIVAALQRAGDGIDQLDDHISTLPDKDLQKLLRTPVGPILAAHYDLMSIVTDRFPELNPYPDD